MLYISFFDSKRKTYWRYQLPINSYIIWRIILLSNLWPNAERCRAEREKESKNKEPCLQQQRWKWISISIFIHGCIEVLIEYDCGTHSFCHGPSVILIYKKWSIQDLWASHCFLISFWIFWTEWWTKLQGGQFSFTLCLAPTIFPYKSP